MFIQNLALCTAALLYILSRDRLNMDLDRACLELMIRLLELEQDDSVTQDNKVKEKIQKLCETVHNKHLDLHNITVSCLLTFKSIHSILLLYKHVLHYDLYLLFYYKTINV